MQPLNQSGSRFDGSIRRVGCGGWHVAMASYVDGSTALLTTQTLLLNV